MEFIVRNNRSNLRLIPYIGNKSGFAHIFDALIPEKFSKMKLYDLFGGGGAFAFYACHRFGAKNVVYNEKNPVITNLMKYFQKDPIALFNEYEKHRKKNKFNCPMRKNSVCPKVDKEQFLFLNKTIKKMKICNQDYKDFSDLKKSFLYLDPPYMYNPNEHYSGLVDPNEFISFVNRMRTSNKIMISEQNSPDKLKLSDKFFVHNIYLKRSLQYVTKDQSQEIIAINYHLSNSYSISK